MGSFSCGVPTLSCVMWGLVPSCSFAESCLTLYNPMGSSMSGFPVLHCLPEFAQTHCPSSQWCHPIISSSVIPFSSCPQSLPASESFPMGHFLASGGHWELQLQHQVTNGSFSFSISPSNEYSELICFRIDWWDLCAVQGTLKSLLSTPQFKSINSLVFSFLCSPTLTSIHDYWKNHSFD